ncbi:VOC family protein [Benzoatithermus flavus]|uniref:VOC family protein n=1 Tax=Benzoatithermus flavus TaxID=3108223 RepID=UPI003AACCB63
MELLVNIDVDDLARAERFYCEALGLSVGRRFGDGFVELLGACAKLYLLAKSAGSAIAPGAARTRNYDRHWTPVHLDIVVSDLDAAVRRAVAAGARPEGEVREGAYGRIAQFADPFGHGFCLIEFNEQGYDAIATT